jgi:hypothetical protein
VSSKLGIQYPGALVTSRERGPKKGVRGEWRLDKTQNFLTQRLALARSGTVNEENAS